MKRIDAMVPTIKRNDVIKAIMATGVGGLSIVETRGKGSGERPMVGGARGTARYVAEYSRNDTIIVMAEDSKVQSVISAIIKSAHTGKKGDGKIFVSQVVESYDISTKEHGKS